MAEKNVQLKNGNDSIYPRTKIGNIVNNDGTPWTPSSGGLQIDDVYPVGSIYLSANSTSPASLFGGTWTQLKDKFLLGAGTYYTLNGTGGSKTVKLTTANLPSHSHTINATVRKGKYSSTVSDYGDTGNRLVTNSGATTTTISSLTSSSSVGSGTAHDNMPPYLVVNMWKRTA